MRRATVLVCTYLVGLLGCAGNSSSGNEGPDGSTHEAGPDSTANEGGPTDSAVADTGVTEAATSDSGSDGGGAAEAATDAALDATTCPASWLVPSGFDPRLDVPDGDVVVLHAAGVGTQVYACVPSGDAGLSTWTLQGPDAVLNDCEGMLIGHHFASEGGASYPEWQTLDGTYVVGHPIVKLTPDGGAASIPWLLVQAVDAGGAGTLSQVTYVQRLDTDGGLLSGQCDAGGAIQAVPYTADYFFYGP